MNLTNPKIAIVGSGAIGSYYGCRLANAGADVHFLVRSDLEAVRAKGQIRVQLPTSEIVVPAPKVYGTPEEIGPCDLVIIALKTTANGVFDNLIRPLLKDPEKTVGRQLADALPPAEARASSQPTNVQENTSGNALSGGTMLLTLQNGLGSDEQLASLFGAERVLGGLCFICVNRTAPGEILCIEPGALAFGEFGRPVSERLRAVVALFERSGVKCSSSDNLAELRWKKLVWNVPFNGLAIAAGGITTDKILASQDLENQVRALMTEVIESAAKFGFIIPPTFIEKQISSTRPMGPYRPSSLIDYLDGREVEVESIWGEPLRRAKAAGAAVPRMEMLYALLKQLTKR